MAHHSVDLHFGLFLGRKLMKTARTSNENRLTPMSPSFILPLSKPTLCSARPFLKTGSCSYIYEAKHGYLWLTDLLSGNMGLPR